MDLVGATSHRPDRTYRGMRHHRVAGRDAHARNPAASSSREYIPAKSYRQRARSRPRWPRSRIAWCGRVSGPGFWRCVRRPGRPPRPHRRPPRRSSCAGRPRTLKSCRDRPLIHGGDRRRPSRGTVRARPERFRHQRRRDCHRQNLQNEAAYFATLESYFGQRYQASGYVTGRDEIRVLAVPQLPVNVVTRVLPRRQPLRQPVACEQPPVGPGNRRALRKWRVVGAGSSTTWCAAPTPPCSSSTPAPTRAARSTRSATCSASSSSAAGVGLRFFASSRPTRPWPSAVAEEAWYGWVRQRYLR